MKIGFSLSLIKFLFLTLSIILFLKPSSFHNLLALHYELKYETYHPKKLKEFIVRDPKTRRIHKSDFRDRIIHHAIVNVLEPIFDKTFIYDSYANRKGKGALKAVQRFSYFLRKFSRMECLLKMGEYLFIKKRSA